MLRIRCLGRSLAACAALIAVALPLNGNAHASRPASPASLVFTFGITGGNMIPWSVSIHADGSLTPVHTNTYATALTDPTNTLNGLKKLARAEKFLSMRSQACGVTNPDVSGRFIIATIGGTRHQVHMLGTCNHPFNQVWAMLYAVAGANPG